MTNSQQNGRGPSAKSAPRESDELCIARDLHILSALTRRVLEEGVEHEHGHASFTQLMILKWLSLGGRRRSKDVARFLAASAPAATQILARMKERGLLRSRRDPLDARTDRITITPRGEKLVEAHDKRKLARLRTALSKLAPPERGRVAEGLEAAIALLLGADPELIDLCLHCGAYASPRCVLHAHGLSCPTGDVCGRPRAAGQAN